MHNLTGRQIALILGCALIVATLAVGVYGLLRGPSEPTPDPVQRRSNVVEVVPEARRAW